MKAYQELVQHVLDRGTRKENRTGIDTLSTFGYYYAHDMREGFPLLTTKKIDWTNIVLELIWFLSGHSDVSWLQKHNIHFWDDWLDDKGRPPSAYGYFWRNYPVHKEQKTKPTIAELEAILRDGGHDKIDILPDGQVVSHNMAYVDQIAWMIGELRRNPMSRRLVALAWAPGNALASKLPPCHYTFALNVQNEENILAHTFDPGEPDPVPVVTKRLCLHMTQRSADIALGVPYNIASYSLLLHLFARFANLGVGIFGHSLIDAHIYTAKPDGSKAEYDHVPGLREQLTRKPKPLPTLTIDPSIRDLVDVLALMSLPKEAIMERFTLSGYDPHPAIKFKVAV